MSNELNVTRMMVTFPTPRVLDVVEMMMQTQAALASTGDVLNMQVIKVNKETFAALDGREEELVPNIDGDTAEMPPLPPRKVKATPGQAARLARKRYGREGTNQVVYRVIDPRIVVGRVPYDVRMCLLDNGPMSAKDVEAKTGKGQKSIESALWGLRNAGSVESVPVEEGKTVTQRKFTKSQIKQGAPLTA